MTTMTHYEDEVLLSLLERGGTAAAIADDHVAVCMMCRTKVGEYESLVESLRAESVWDARPVADEPARQTVAFLRGFVQSAREEDEAAGILVAELLAGTREEWMPRLVADSKYRTAGVVRRLCSKADDVSGKWPADELAITELATEIAEHLSPESYAPHTVARLRGDAWRDRAFALDYTGELHAAMAAITRAKQQYDTLPVADYDLARLELTRALILRHFDRCDEGLQAVRLAEPYLRASGDANRVRMARLIEAAMRFRARDYRQALNIFIELETDIPAEDQIARARVLVNIGSTYRELGEYDRALDYSRRAAAQISNMQLPSGEIARVRWTVGELLLKMQRYSEAEQVLKEVTAGFDERQMREESVLARLDLTELLIVQSRFEEAIATCEAVVAELRHSGLDQTSRALTAVTFLQEATRSHHATAKLARHVRDFVRDSKVQPALLFAPPPG